MIVSLMPAMRRPALLSIALALAPIATPATAELPVAGYEVVKTYPHDPHAFTQGLFYRDGHLFESTGLEGQSTIRKVRIEDGAVVKSVALPPTLFGEGIVDWKEEIVSVTWRDGIGFRWDRETFARTGEFRYDGEGWGLTQDGSNLILSDGTAWLRFLYPATMTTVRRVEVTAEGEPVANLNELEWVDGEIFANVWMTDRIARIDPASGHVTGWIDLAGLGTISGRCGVEDVLNGIAYDSERDRLFVTGKNWPRLFEIDLKRADSAP